MDARIAIQDGDSRSSVFKTFWPETPPELIEFLRLAEEEGAYAALALRSRRILEMSCVEGLEIPQIADVFNVTRQAIENTLKFAPRILFRKMRRDAASGRTTVGRTQITATYDAYEASRARSMK